MIIDLREVFIFSNPVKKHCGSKLFLEIHKIMVLTAYHFVNIVGI